MFKSIFKAVAVSAVAAFFCVGCGGDDDDDGNPLLPDDEIWMRVGSCSDAREFRSDGSVHRIWRRGTGRDYSNVGSWSGKTITYSNGDRGTFERIGDQLTIYSEDGKAITYKKFKTNDWSTCGS